MVATENQRNALSSRDDWRKDHKERHDLVWVGVIVANLSPSFRLKPQWKEVRILDTKESSKVIRKRIKKSREGMAQLLDSAGHVSSVVEFSEKLEIFLEEVDQQLVAREEKKVSRLKSLSPFISLLLPVYRLLMVVLAEAKKLFEQVG